MIDFSALRKFIYFPHAYQRTNAPYIVYVLDKWGESWKGGRDVEEVLAGKFSFYAITRCQPYSEELWQACLKLIERRTELDKDFETLMTKGLMKI